MTKAQKIILSVAMALWLPVYLYLIKRPCNPASSLTGNCALDNLVVLPIFITLILAVPALPIFLIWKKGSLSFIKGWSNRDYLIATGFFILGFFFFVFFSLFKNFSNMELKSANKQIKVATTSAQAVSPLTCTDQQLGISDLPDYLKNNGQVLRILRQSFGLSCEVVLGSSNIDVTGDGTPDILLNTSGFGCASCHQRTVRVIDGSNNQVIFELMGDNLAIQKSPLSINGIQIIEPLRWHDVPLCCATEGVVSNYIYIPSPHDPTDTSNTVNNSDFFYLYDARSVKY